MLPTLIVVVLIVVVGVAVLAYRNRAQRGIESGISSFRRELRALAPERSDPPRPHGPMADPPRTSGVGILRPDPTDEPGPHESETQDPAGDDDIERS